MSEQPEPSYAEKTADAPEPAPAAHEVEKAGGPMLPGFENLTERQDEGRKSWSA